MSTTAATTEANMPKSTPLLKKTSAYSSEAPPMSDERKLNLESQMRGRFLGAIPVEKFLDKYLKPDVNVIDVPSRPQDLLGKMSKAKDEESSYDPFMNAIAECIPGLKAVKTCKEPARSDFADMQLKPDVCLFKPNFDLNDFRNKSYFSVMEMWIEFKHEQAPFADPPADKETDHTTHAFEVDTMSAKLTRGQLTAYAIAQHAEQFRHFSFSVSIVNTRARFLRWDPAGIAVTEEFDYVAKPEFLVNFLWKFSHLSDEKRGHDLSVRPMTEDDVFQKEVIDNLELKADTPLFEYDVPDLPGRCYGPAPPYPSRSIISRSTRSLPVLYIPTTQDVQTVKDRHSSSGGRVAYLKDTWRYRSLNDKKIETECEIYKVLNANHIPHVPRLEGGGDMTGYGSTTETDKLVEELLYELGLKLCGKPKIIGFIHCRFLLDIFGRALSTFKSTKELVNGILCAILAHGMAFELLRLLHRDISFGNIILTDDGNGWLIDWEFAKHVDEIGNSRPERTGTWQFMSAKLLQDVNEHHTVMDDLESFLHVLAWATIRYVPTTDKFTSSDREDFLKSIFDQSRIKGGKHIGGRAKIDRLAGRGYPPDDFALKDSSPLPTLLRKLSEPFQSRYALQPPTEKEISEYEELKTTDASIVLSDASNITLLHRVNKYNLDMEHLESHKYFIDSIKESLNDEWPLNDAADTNLIDFSSSRLTRREQEVRRSRMYMDQKQWEGSKGSVSTASLKRQYTSPTPPSKRSRSGTTPLGSGTDI